MMSRLTPAKLARYFDNALLKSDATGAEIARACEETLAHGFFGLAVNPCWNTLVAETLRGSESFLIAVAGFPQGATTTEAKISEALAGASAGAREVDMVANIGWIAGGESKRAEEEISRIRAELPDEVALKVIIEAPLLPEKLIRESCELVINAGARFVKTATGFFGATTTQIVDIVIDQTAGRIPVKASGGIRTLAQAEEYITRGASRLGSSAGAAILKELAERETISEGR